MMKRLRKRILVAFALLAMLFPPTVAVFAQSCGPCAPSSSCPFACTGAVPTAGTACFAPPCAGAWTITYTNSYIQYCCDHHMWACGVYGPNAETGYPVRDDIWECTNPAPPPDACFQCYTTVQTGPSFNANTCCPC